MSFYAVAAATAFLLLDTSGMAAMLFAAVLLHECGHLLALAVFRVRVSRVDIGLSGVVIAAQSAGCLGRRLFSFLSGSGANIAAALFCALVLHSARAYVFSAANTVVAVMSLLPLSGSDGGEALRELLCAWGGEAEGTRVAGVLSLLFSGALVVFIAAMAYLRGQYLWGAAVLALIAARLFAREVE